MPGSAMNDAQALPEAPVKSPTGPARRADAGVYSPEGIRSSRRLRNGRRMWPAVISFCGVLAAAALWVVVPSIGPRSTAWERQPQPVSPSFLYPVRSGDPQNPASLVSTTAGSPSSDGGTAHSTRKAQWHDNGQGQPDWGSPDWNPSAVNITSCMAESDDETPFTVQDFGAAQPGRLRVEAAFYSTQRPALPVTVTVTATTGKLPTLQGLCESWPGPLSVAFYLAVIADGSSVDERVAAAVAAVNSTFQKLEGARRCQADVIVYSERVADGAAAALFPINILRNNAILAARTPLVLLADADLLVGADLAAAMADPLEYQQALDLCRRKHFVVVPVLETLRTSRAYTCAKGGKRVVVEHMQAGKAWGLKTQHSDFLHGSTDFPRWATAEAPFRIHKPHARYEPWGLMYRPALGFFDVRYRGYGRNKVQHLHMHLTQLGWRYSVHHRGYMMHRPHKITAAKRQFMAGNAIAAQASAAVAAGADPQAALAAAARDSPGNLVVFGTNNGFLEDQKAAGDRYRPVLTPGFERCRAQLPWWQIYSPGGEPMPAATAPLPPQQEVVAAATA